MKPCIKAGRLEPGQYYLEVALSMDPNCLEALTSLARCQLLMGHWMDAMKVKRVLIQKIVFKIIDFKVRPFGLLCDTRQLDLLNQS